MKIREVDQWNWVEDPDINLHTCGQLLFNKEANNIQWKIECIFNKLCRHSLMLAHKRIPIDPGSISLHKTQVQVDQRPQHKSSYSEPDRRESGK